MSGNNHFSFCNTELPEAKAVMLGCIDKEQTSGAVNAPDALRYFAKKSDDYHLSVDRSLSDLKIQDGGNISLDFNKGKEPDRDFSEIAFSHFDNGRFLFTIAENRSVTYSLLKSAHKKYPQLKVLILDAHHGMESAEETFNRRNYLAHAVKDFLPAENVIKMGIREGSQESYAAGLRRHKHLPPRVKKGVLERLPKLYHMPVYVSLDMDVFDPAYAPGVVHPSSCGVAPIEILDTIYLLQSVPVVGMDLVGYVPQRDTAEITASLAYKMLKEALTYFL